MIKELLPVPVYTQCDVDFEQQFMKTKKLPSPWAYSEYIHRSDLS